MDYSSYQQVTGVIQEIRRGNSCCDLLISIRTDNETVNFMVSGDTKIVDNTRLRRGIRISRAPMENSFSLLTCSEL
ncbi:MAG TPA: hypothetical protein H9935_12325 [Candidatus Blautia merdigallinarum]|uniref:Uncharacterized protein n=1 Tax=Candidatus Blautia merdigallinarum TaxID=2838495 RepID=A0A9D2SKA9_9FIRM|nr:hypothetical protein [Candidatus Blautia merdigallinarum]